MGGFPDVFRAKLKYSERLYLNPSALSYAYNTYRCNSAFEPDASGSVGECTGFSQLAALYTQFFVRSSRIIVKPVYVANSGAEDAMYIYILRGDANTVFPPSGTAIEDFDEIKNCNGPLICTGLQNMSDPRLPRKVSMGYSAKKAYLDPKARDSWSSCSTNPDFSVTFGVFAVAPTIGYDPDPAWVNVTIVYDVLFRNRKFNYAA